MEYSLKTSSLSLFFVPSTRYTLCPSRVCDYSSKWDKVLSSLTIQSSRRDQKSRQIYRYTKSIIEINKTDKYFRMISLGEQKFPFPLISHCIILICIHWLASKALETFKSKVRNLSNPKKDTARENTFWWEEYKDNRILNVIIVPH